MTSPFPELRVLALVESAEAVATNAENAVLYEIGAVVGTEDVVMPSMASSEECSFSLGDGTVDKVLARIMGTLCRIFQGVFARLEEFGTLIADAIRDVVGGLVETIRTSIGEFITSITAGIAAVVSGLAAKVSEIIDSIVETLAGVVDAITEQVRRVVDSLNDIVSAIFDKISDVVTSIVNKLGDAVSAVVEKVGAVLTAIRDLIGSIIGTVIDAVWTVITRIGEGIGTLIDTLVGTAEAGLGRVRQVIEDIPTALRELATEAQEFIGESIGGPLANIGSLFVEQIENFFRRLIDDLEVSPAKILRDFLSGLGMPADLVERFAQSADDAMPRTPAIFALGAIAIIPLVISPLLAAVLSPVTDELRQEVAQRVTPTLIPVGDALEAFHRGAIDETQLIKELGEAGFSQQRIDVLLDMSMRLMGIGNLVNWWLRGFVTDNQLDNLFAMHRITGADGANLKRAAFFIPPVQDLIRMAVREVFTPDIRTRFQLDEGFPTEFQEAAKRQGVSEEWAKNYWAAHWVLPSVTQGFSMLHRKVITAEDLDLLLRAQDVMPFWRERITQVAFHPLTRVDVRRMHRLGLLDLEQLQARYEDLGFDADNAAMMVKFTEAFNQEEDADVAIELEGLTRGTILGMFDDGVLTQDESTAALLDLGISESAADLFITQRKMEVERKERTGQIDTIIKLAGGGHIDLAQAQDSLSGLGLTDIEIKLAVQRITRARGARDRLPTLAQLNKMLQGDIVTPGQWESAMAGLGYSDVWIGRLAKLLASGATVGE